jgi:hypothetical protein
MENPLALPSVVGRLGRNPSKESRLISFVKSIAFWIAVIIPFTYLPVLAMEAFIPMQSGVFISLIITNIISLLVGHNYTPTR